MLGVAHPTVKTPVAHGEVVRDNHPRTVLDPAESPMISQKRNLLTLVAAALVAALVWIAIAFRAEPGTNPVDAPQDERVASPTDPDGGTAPEVERQPVRLPNDAVSRDQLHIRGRVLDPYGDALGAAYVGDAAADGPVTTRADGSFDLAVDRAALPVTLLVLAAGQAPLLAPLEIGAAVRSFDAGDIQLLKAGGITGKVTDGANQGLPDVTVTPSLQSAGVWNLGFDFSALLPPTRTTADGSYTFATLMPGRYRLTASLMGMQARESNAITVGEGVVAEVEPIVMQIGYELAGLVLGPDESPVSGASVRIRNGRNQPRFDAQAETANDGRFAMSAMPPGPLRLEVQKEGFLQSSRSDLDTTSGELLVIRLEAGLRITGTVGDARSAAPVEFFATSLRRVGDLDAPSNGTMTHQLHRQIDTLREEAASSSDPKLRNEKLEIANQFESRLVQLRLDSQSRPHAVPSDLGPAKPREGGRFAFEGLEEGIYSVGIASPDHQFSKVEGIELRRGSPAPELRVELVAGEILTGIVVAKLDGSPISGATVEFVRVSASAREPATDQHSLYPWVFARSGPPGVTVMSTRTGSDGHFEFRQAVPGACLLAVRHPHTADHETDILYLRGARMEVRITVDARANLTGRVGNVAPHQRGKIEVLALGGHGTMRTVKAGADDSYRFDDLQPGSYIVRAYPADASQYVNRLFGSIFPLYAGAVDPETIPACDLTLVAGETRVFDPLVDLPPTGVVEGTVSINNRMASSSRAILRPVSGEAPGSGGLSLRANCDESGRFTIRDVPAGNYLLSLYGANYQELHREAITVAPGSTATVRTDLAAGGLRGRVLAPDAAPMEELRGYLWVLPGAVEAPADLYEYRRTERTHRISVRNGTFGADALTPGPAVIVVDLRGRSPVTTPVTITAGNVLETDLRAGARGR